MSMITMNKKKWIVAIVTILAIVAAYFGYTQYKAANSSKATYVTGKVERGTVSRLIDSTGTINPVNYVDVSTNVAGTLKEVLVSENDVVRKGQTIAHIDPTALQAMLDDASATLEKTRTDYERYQSLYQSGAVSAQSFDAARASYLTAQAAYTRAEKNLNDATIEAPMDGTIVGTPLKAGQTISTGLSSQMIIATIADLSRMEIYLSVDETDIAGISIGQEVTFTVDAYTDRTFSGKVSSIAKGTKGNMGTTSSSVVYYKVKVEVDKDQVKDLLPTMTARASIHGRQVKDALLVPLTAIHSDSGSTFVYIIKDGKPVRQTVETGITGGSNIQILKGLEEGQELVVSGSVDNSSSKSQSTRPMF